MEGCHESTGTADDTADTLKLLESKVYKYLSNRVVPYSYSFDPVSTGNGNPGDVEKLLEVRTTKKYEEATSGALWKEMTISEAQALGSGSMSRISVQNIMADNQRKRMPANSAHKDRPVPELHKDRRVPELPKSFATTAKAGRLTVGEIICSIVRD